MRRESVIIVRHGRSQHNVGQSKELDSPLTDFGIQQAKVVGRYFGRGSMGNLSDYVFHVSPFLRCLMTAKYIREEAGDMFKDTTFFIDKNVAEYLVTGNPDVHIINRQEEFPEFNWRYHLASLQKETGSDTYVHKGELPEKFLRRMQLAHDGLANKAIVVSHGISCLTLANELVNPLQYIPIWDHSINNCSITWVENGRKKWHGRNLHHEIEYQDHKEFHI